MVEKNLQVVWDEEALEKLHEIYLYIQENSHIAADKVRTEIFSKTDSLSTQALKHPADKFKQNNDGTYRAFEIYSYRIAYKITPEKILILRIRHTKQEPLEY